MARFGLHKFISSSFHSRINVTVPQNGYSFGALLMNAHRMIWFLKRKFPVWNFAGIAPTPTWPNWDIIPTLFAIRIRLWYSICVKSTLTTDGIWCWPFHDCWRQFDTQAAHCEERYDHKCPFESVTGKFLKGIIF